jgi:hypothetical protein
MQHDYVHLFFVSVLAISHHLQIFIFWQLEIATPTFLDTHTPTFSGQTWKKDPHIFWHCEMALPHIFWQRKTSLTHIFWQREIANPPHFLAT